MPYTALEADLNFEMIYMLAKGGDKEHRRAYLLSLVGITVSLCGLLVCVSAPGCQPAGVWLINTGIGILSSHAIQKRDDTTETKKGEQ